ncbi:DUF3962 domain-containing protein [Actinoplanes sp. NPDC026670]|uniref:pPIWI_RE module domain-containing protein n=1 Tax=Actinoplanes sp. NPDC026670 TaxID=3154700 RepID=UPI0033C78B32
MGPDGSPHRHQRSPRNSAEGQRVSTPVDTEKPAKKRKPLGKFVLLNTLEIQSNVHWKQTFQAAALPPHWRTAFKTAYHQAHPQAPQDRSLPTRGLIEILIGVDPAVIHVDWNLHSDTFIIAFDDADTTVLTAAIAAWASTEINPAVDWFTELDPRDLARQFTESTADLLTFGQRPNGTAAVPSQVYDLLPTFLAQHVLDNGLLLLGQPRGLILGPPQRNNRRDVVLWPPITLDTDDAGPSLVTAKISIHLETSPQHAAPRVHADLSMSRFPLMPVTYVPARGDGGAGATLWLHAPNGFLRRHEPRTLLSAPIEQVWNRDGERQWKFKPGLARALAALTHLPFPSPDKVMSQPAITAGEGDIRAYMLYSEGTKSEAADIDEPDDERSRSKSLLHAANTGFVPGDHREVLTAVSDLFAPLGITTSAHLPRVGSTIPRKIKTRFDPRDTYTIELWTHNPITRAAVLATLEVFFGLTRTDDPDNDGVVRFTGALDLTVLLRDGSDFAAGIARRPGDKRPEAALLGAHATGITRTLKSSPSVRAAILELGGDKHFARMRVIDPKKALKKGFARSGRPLQCLRPAELFKPPQKVSTNPNAKKKAPFPGTNFKVSTIQRCAAAVNDALRQLGRIGDYELPANLPELEHIGVWLHHSGSTCIPIVVRHQPGHEPTAVLATTTDGQPTVIAYQSLPQKLAEGHGRIPGGPHQKKAIAEFLTNVLGVQAPQQHQHRIVLVRAASFRKWGWDWLQDKHITPDRLILPGVILKDDQQTPAVLTPAECPGLRILRIRDRGTGAEVPRGLSHDPEQFAERVSGVFRFNDRTYYAINPKPDQVQVPLEMTKLDPDLHANLTRAAPNPVPLEVCVAFQQPGDDTDSLVLLAHQLRRAHSHTEQATRYPGVMHLCHLAAEYL